MNLPKLSLKEFRRDISRDFVSSEFVTSRNKHHTTSRSVQIRKKPYVRKKTCLESSVTSQKGPQEDDVLLAPQKQSKFVQNGCVVSAMFHCVVS
ncbi:hypothetical protein TNCV_1624351 [Trichonephila clavipes]|nr:hypothetical protein TNCV_1624351 [Trichonephila clavipes]